MSGLGDTLYLPWGASGKWRMQFAKPEDGSAIDLTLATAIEWFLLNSAATSEADAFLALALGDGITRLDNQAGTVQVAITAAQSAALRSFGEFFTYAKATFADGTVLIPDLLRCPFFNNLDSALEQELTGAPIKRLDAASGVFNPVTPDMSNYVGNRYDLTALTGGLATALDGLSADTLGLMSNGARLVVGLLAADGEQIRAEFQLGLLGADVELAPWIIVCDNAATRCWRLAKGSVSKGGLPAVYNETTEKWYRVWSVGAAGGETLAQDDNANAFVFP